MRYAGGTRINRLIDGSDSTNLVANLSQALQDAGWSVASGSGTDVTLLSAATPDGLQMRQRLHISGVNWVIPVPANAAGTLSSPDLKFGMFARAASAQWRVIATRYQAFAFVPGSTANYDFLAFGVPWLPARLSGVITECAWCAQMGRDQSGDFSGGNRGFRNSLSYASDGQNGSTWCMVNGTAFNPDFWYGIGNLRLIFPHSTGIMSSWVHDQVVWHDGSAIVADPLISFGTSQAAQHAIRGGMWDAFVSGDFGPADAVTTAPDGTKFMRITDNNSGSTVSAPRGSLWVAIP